MKLEPMLIAASGHAEGIRMTHGEKEIHWHVINRSIGGEGFDVFEQINQYWASLPNTKQDKIFGIYEDIYAQFDQQTWDIETLTMNVRPRVAKLFNEHKQEDLQYWVSYHSDIQIPRSFDAAAEAFDKTMLNPGVKERTYLRQDYALLIPLAISMRLMIPVWGEFIMRTKAESGTHFKEYMAFQLLATSSVMECPAMKRLELFIAYTIPPDTNKDTGREAAILRGIGSEDFAMWVMGLIVVRRLCIGDVRGVDQQSTLVSFMYGYITHRITSVDMGSGTIVHKRAGESGQAGDNNHSLLEGFRIKQQVPIGDIGLYAYYIEETMINARQGIFPPQGMIKRLVPGATPALIEACWQSVKQLETVSLNPAQIAIMAWVTNDLVDARVIPYLHKTDVFCLMTVAAAYLICNKHIELAALMTASLRPISTLTTTAIGIPPTRLSRETFEAISKAFPYEKRTSSRAKMAKAEFSKYVAQLTLPVEYVSALTGSGRVRRYQRPPDIRNKLANLILEINSRELAPLVIDEMTA
jgi:hypothetical protein